MAERLVNLVEDIGLGLNMEDLAPKPEKEGGSKDERIGTNSEENRK